METYMENELLYQKQCKLIVKQMKKLAIKTVDWNITDDEEVQLLDKNDNILTTISIDELTKL